MTSRHRFALLIVLEATLIFGIVGLWTLRNSASNHARDRVALLAPPPVDMSQAVRVAERFEKAERMRTFPYAEELPSWDAAHIVRRSPLDRREETNTSSRQDYFLEGTGPADHEASVREIRLSQPSCWGGGEDGNGRTYVIEGDLWIHSHEALTIWLRGEDNHVTFLVRGDIHFRDDFRVEGGSRVEFIALRDAAGEGGNIFMSDPDYATLDRIDGFLYAESDVLIVDVGAGVVVHGGVSAGGSVRAFNSTLQIR